MSETIDCKHWYPVRCPKCGWEGCSRSCGSGDYFAQDGCQCPRCHEECGSDDENRSTTSQWTTEKPTEPGWYFQCQKNKDILLAQFYLCSDGLVSCAYSLFDYHYVDSHDSSEPVYWCKVICPELPWLAMPPISERIPQWSSEVPQTDGEYWIVDAYGKHPVQILTYVNASRKKTRLIRIGYSGNEFLLERYCDAHPDAQWLPMDIPPSPKIKPIEIKSLKAWKP